MKQQDKEIKTQAPATVQPGEEAIEYLSKLFGLKPRRSVIAEQHPELKLQFCARCQRLLHPAEHFPGSKSFVSCEDMEKDSAMMYEVYVLRDKFSSLVREFIENSAVPYFMECLYELFSCPSDFEHYIDDIELNNGLRLRFLTLAINDVPYPGGLRT